MGWDRLVVVAAAVVGAVMLFTGSAKGDTESIVLGAAFAGAAALARFLPRWRWLVEIGLALLFANVLFWMATAAVANVSSGEGLIDVAVPVVLSVVSAAGVIAVVAAAIDRRRPVKGAPAVGAAAIAVIVVATAASQLAGGDGDELRPGDVVVDTEDAVFVPDELELPAGAVTVVTRNRDLFWHTLTIDALDLDIRVPVGATRRRTFTAPPGTYEYYCAIPGHEAIGMKGVLVVR